MYQYKLIVTVSGVNSTCLGGNSCVFNQLESRGGLAVTGLQRCIVRKAAGFEDLPLTHIRRALHRAGSVALLFELARL